MALACATIAEQHDRLSLVEIRARRQEGHRLRLDRGRGGGVELGERLLTREVGIVDASLAATLGAVVGLGREHLGEIGEVAEARPLGGGGKALGLGTHRRKAQLASSRPDRGEGDDVGGIGRQLASRSSS